MIYRELAGRMFPICLRYSSSKEEAKDWLQEAFIKLFKSLKKFDVTKSAFETWVQNMFKHFCIDQYRKKKTAKHDWIDYCDINDYISYPTDEFTEKDYQDFQKIKVDALLVLIQNRLTSKERVIFNMLAIDDYMYDDVADELQIPLGTVKGTYHRARMKIREAVIGKLEDVRC